MVQVDPYLDTLIMQRVACGHTAVLGHFPDYMRIAQASALLHFDVSDGVWRLLDRSERWGCNRMFLRRVISKQQTFLLATPPCEARPGSWFARELAYVQRWGYRLSDDGMSLRPPTVSFPADLG